MKLVDVDWLILGMAIVCVVFKWLLWRLTGFWPFLVLAFAFAYIAVTRIAVIFWQPRHINEWVFFFWPLCTVSVIGLYLSLHSNMRPKGQPRYGRRKGDLKPPATK